MILHRQNNFYRVKSGYFRSDEDVKNQAKEKLAVRFPEIPIEKEIKVEKVYTEYRYGQISTLRELGGTILVTTNISKYDLVFQLLYFSIKNAQNLAYNLSFACTCIKKFVSIFVIVFKNFPHSSFSLHCIITQYLFPEPQIFNPVKELL